MSCACSMCAGSEAFGLEPSAIECWHYVGHPVPESLDDVVARVAVPLIARGYVVSLRELFAATSATHLDVGHEHEIVESLRVQLLELSARYPIPRVRDERLSTHRQLRCGACLCAVEPHDAWCPLPDCAVEFKTLSNTQERVAAE